MCLQQIQMLPLTILPSFLLVLRLSHCAFLSRIRSPRGRRQLVSLLVPPVAPDVVQRGCGNRRSVIPSRIPTRSVTGISQFINTTITISLYLCRRSSSVSSFSSLSPSNRLLSHLFMCINPTSAEGIRIAGPTLWGTIEF